MALPVGEFLSLQFGTVWSSANTHGAGEAGHALDKREKLLQAHALVSCKPETPLLEVVQSMVTKGVHEVFVLNEDSHALSVITPTDVLRVCVA